MFQRATGLCAFLSMSLLLICTFGPAFNGAAPTVESREGPQPMVSSPTGSGPYTISYIDDTLTFSTKSYTTTIRIYYPANSSGVNAGVNRSAAPYPCINWFTGTGGDHTSYASYLTQMASWGFLVAAWDVNINDFPNNGNVSDVNEFLDHLELRNATPGDKLNDMVDKKAYGMAGHSMGGGMTFANGARVDRVKVGVTHAAAMSNGVVDAYAPNWDKKKILMQAGTQDTQYKGPTIYAKGVLKGIHEIVEIYSAGHQVWQNEPQLFHAFFLYWLDEQTDYFPYIFGNDVCKKFVDGIYDLQFLYNATHYFPPKISSATADRTSLNMDSSVNFTANMSGFIPTGLANAVYEWDFEGEGTFEYSSMVTAVANHTYTAPGTFNALFQFRFGTVLTIQPAQPLVINVKNVNPVAVLGPDMSAIEDSPVQLDGAASYDTPSDTSSLKYKWDFGDSVKTDYGTNKTISHTYKKPSIFTVTLSVKDAHGAEATAKLKVNVSNVGPTAKVGQNVTVNEDGAVDLKGTGSDTASDLSGLKFKWDFGDGNGTDWSSSTEAQKTYARAGNYTAVFHVRDEHGAEATSSLKVTVNNVKPVATMATPQDGEEFPEDEEVSFSGAGSDTQSDMGLGLEYQWDFGDGAHTDWSKLAAATHVYTKKGSYKVKFTVRDNDGASDWQQISIGITNPAPVAKIEGNVPANVNEDVIVQFKGSGTDTASDINNLNFTWDFGDGTVAYGKSANHSYSVAKAYTVTLTVTDDEGEKGTAVVQVTVANPKPVAKTSASNTTVKVDDVITFSSSGSTDTASDLAGLKFSWNFGDGSSSDSQNPTHAYTTAGPKTVTLTVTDDEGAFSTQSVTITVQPKGGGGGGGGGGTGGTNMLPYMLAAIVAVIVVVVVVVLLMKRKKGPSIEKEPEEKAEKRPEPEEPKKEGPKEEKPTTMPPPPTEPAKP